ncbi:MAG: hypothetical protein JWO38_2921 [Gemmataceae bacterium]|nr:hypothetical protein [Gemmataceae bacterium]
MTNGSGPHPKAGGKKKAGADGTGKRKPQAEMLKKGLKQKSGPGSKKAGG